MQTLNYEASWDKAISKRDRQELEALFSSLDTFPPFTVVRHALSHKKELLVTAIVHNTADQPLLFQEQRIMYSIGGKQIAENTFSLSSFIVPPKTSMPWTFIFPAGSWQENEARLGELYFG